MTRLRASLLVAVAALMISVPLGGAQDNADNRMAWADFTAREEIAPAADLEGAVRILRFVQVSDAHILDDDAPYPIRQEPLDQFGSPLEGAARPHDEYTDELLNAIIQSINTRNSEDPFDFVITTGDNIDNALENELMRFIDNWEGTTTTVGPFSGNTCKPDGAFATDDSNDVTDSCTSLPADLAADNTPLADGLPWYVAFGNHDGLIQGNVPDEPTFREIANEFGRYFLHQEEYVAMHFEGGKSCASGVPAGSENDDFGHGFANAAERLCDSNLDNDGYYTFNQNGVRVIVLDTVNDDFVTGNENLNGYFTPQEQVGNDVMGGYAEGSLDPDQYAWLEAVLKNNKDDAILIFSHHTVNSMYIDNVPNECQDGIGCMHDLLTESGYKTGQDMIALLTQHDNVLAWIGGHTHQHRIQAKTAAGNEHGFWNVETSSIIDLPQEARTIEIWKTVDNKLVLRLEPFGHEYGPGKDAAKSDEQQNPTQSGELEDQAVLLWADAPDTLILRHGTQPPGTPPDEFGGYALVNPEGTAMELPGSSGPGGLISLNAAGVYDVSVTAQNAGSRNQLPHLDLDVQVRIANATGTLDHPIVLNHDWVDTDEFGEFPTGPNAQDESILSVFTAPLDFYAEGNYTLEVRYLSVAGDVLQSEAYTVSVDDPALAETDSGLSLAAMPFIIIGLALAVLGARRS